MASRMDCGVSGIEVGFVFYWLGLVLQGLQALHLKY